MYEQQKRKQFKTNHQDSLLKTSKNSFSFKNKNNDEVHFYRKLEALDRILEGYDALKMTVLEKQEARSEQIDYSKLYKYIHQAVYLEDDVIHLEEMNQSKSVLKAYSPSIIQLFCFIYTEIKTELEEQDTISNKAFELAEQFKQTYLQPNCTLFDEEHFSDTLRILRGTLEAIETQTVYKDNDFWHFYDAIAAFLKGETQYDEQNIYFGINPFYDVWEDICQNVMLYQQTQNYELLLADGYQDSFKQLKVHPFTLKFNDETFERRLRPDLILKRVHVDSYSDDEVIERVCVLEMKKWYKYENQKLIKWLVTNQYLEDLYTHFTKSTYNNLIYEGEFLKFKQEVVSFIKKDNDLAQLLKLYEIQVVDFKYICLNNLENTKIMMDIQKQLLYEWVIQQHEMFKTYKTVSEFWVPHYGTDLSHENVSDDFQKIKVKKINFELFQQLYVHLFK
jgi:hypothetical protein